MEDSPQKRGIQINKLKRYKLILDLYQKSIKEHPHTPTTKILEIYICPVYPISRTTLYEILCTPVNKLLAEIEQNKNTINECK